MTTRPFEQILSVSDLKHTADVLNNYFFTPGAMRFFDSRIPNFIAPVDGSTGFIITSERFDYTAPREYSVREYTVTREIRASDKRIIDRLSIDTIGAKYTTAHLAKAEARRLANSRKSD